MPNSSVCGRGSRRRSCFGCSRRRLSHWLIEPGIGVLLVWGIFSYFSTVPTGNARRYDIQIKLDPEIAAGFKEDSLANILDREDLLFLREKKHMPRDNVARMAMELPQLPVDESEEDMVDIKRAKPETHETNKAKPESIDTNKAKPETLDTNKAKPETLDTKKVNPETLLRAPRDEVDMDKKAAVEALNPQKLGEKAVADTGNKVLEDPVIYHQQTRPYCPGRRWTLTPNTVKLYDVIGFARHLQQPVGCSGEACQLNEGRSPINVDMSVNPCSVQQCLTVTIKTRFRYENTMQFIDSIHDEFPRLRVIVMDEEQREKFANRSSIDEWENYLQEKGGDLVSYVQAPPGVGFGRKLGAQLAKTKYILVVDDDYLFTKLSNVSRLVELLERSDATIVAGDTSDGFPYAGAFRVAPNKTATENVHLAIYPNVFYELVDCYRNCFVADIVKTFFVADRQAILKAGAWDSERKFYEHEDFFINMRRARYKVVNCKDIKVKHSPINQKLALLRRESHSIWQKHLLQKWKIDDVYICAKYTYKETKTTCANGRHFY